MDPSLCELLISGGDMNTSTMKSCCALPNKGTITAQKCNGWTPPPPPAPLPKDEPKADTSKDTTT